MAYSPDTPYAILMKGRPDDGNSHQGIAVYSKEEYETYRKKGWKPEREFAEMCRRASVSKKGYW